jgi:DNA-binding LytR/AlgR family response regulator
MFKIAICDDEKYYRHYIKDLISEFMRKHSIVCEISTFKSGKMFVELGIGMVAYDAIFLDINMDFIDGIEVAQKIREINKEVFIVFVTAYVNYSLEGYKVNAIRYVLKNNINFQDTITECLEAILDNIRYVIVKLRFNFNEGMKEISLERILYIESRLHKLEFHVMEDTLKTYTMYDTLNKVEKKLDGNNFIRIHQSFLINLKHLNNVIGYKAILSNGIDFSIPKVRYKYVKEMFVAYRGEI